MKRTIIFLAAIFVTLVVACQGLPKDKLFEQPVRLQGGMYLGTETTLRMTWPTGTTMTYPPAGLAMSTGSAWGTSVPNNSAFWNTAYSWGNHAGLYRPVSWVPSWTDVSGKPIFHAVAISGSYNDLTDKPATMELAEALAALPGWKLPKLTQAQINAITPTPELEGTVLWNLTDHVLQIYNGTKWLIYPTTN